MNHKISSSLNIPKLLFLQSSGLTSPTNTKCQLSSWALGRLSQCHRRTVQHTTHSSSITAMDLDREEARYLVLGAGDGTLYIHDILQRTAESDTLLHIGKSHKHCHQHSVVSVGWGEDSGMFTSSSRDGELRVWDTNRGATVEVFNLEMKINRHVLQRGMGSVTVAVAGDKSLVQLVDLRSGSLTHVLRGHTGGGVTCLAWGQDSLLASGGDSDTRVIIWNVVAMLDLTTGKWVNTLSGHFSKIYCIKYNPQQLELYTSGRDRYVHVWSPVESGDEDSESKHLTCDTWSDSD